MSPPKTSPERRSEIQSTLMQAIALWDGGWHRTNAEYPGVLWRGTGDPEWLEVPIEVWLVIQGAHFGVVESAKRASSLAISDEGLMH